MSDRTPRPAPGEALVPINGNVTVATKEALWQIAMAAHRSVSQIVRRALEAYVVERTRDHGEGGE